MVIITYDNFRTVECEFVKYVSQKRGKFKINIISFPFFREELTTKYSEEEIQRFFRMFPYDLDSEVRSEDKKASIKLEIDFYSDIRLITLGKYEYVLVDKSTEELEDLSFLAEVSSQPIVFEEFVVISFYNFVAIAQADLHRSVELNLLDNSKYLKETKYQLYT